MKLKRNVGWIRDPRNPVLPPVEGSEYDSTLCMNPWAVKQGDTYVLFYAGGGPDQHRIVCRATASADSIDEWTRHGRVLDVGEPGSFDGDWCVLPHAIPLEDGKWRLYYTGNSGIGTSLDRFPGLGMAESDDGIHFVKHNGNPVIPPSRQDGDPDALGIAGGSVLRVSLPDGANEWRFYYTGCPTLGKDVFLDQQKVVCLAVSADGVHWEKRGAVMRRDPQRDYENIAVAGPVVHQNEDGSFRMWYSAIGTRWGFYSICYAESEDGIHWNRGTHYGDNLQMGPALSKGNWEGQMVEYPSVSKEEDGSLRLFYCGNGYGKTGIGTAVSTPLRATREDGAAHIAEAGGERAWLLAPPSAIVWDGGQAAVTEQLPWQGPDARGTIWFEQTLLPGLDLRAIVRHDANGLEVSLTFMNHTGQTFANVVAPLTAKALQDNAAGGDLLLDWQEKIGEVGPGSTVTRSGSVRLA
ncbi:hypothetical protein FE784_38915 [Paenibacillus hemerocallicola]|uniref:Glycosyl hydrolase family 32 N-terminal domain-containing protein n=1 Tax=Paenibacillus hemerocallicola TaxID=1172614 RepID=A0A5C4SXZ5_9BACL|nr:hypothetical protein [Paenibacillus hemerocallicola]TNJ56496.1 hypothetical protein FE784_38915 [Paenibacillus hemerocallicola]